MRVLRAALGAEGGKRQEKVSPELQNGSPGVGSAIRFQHFVEKTNFGNFENVELPLKF